VSLHSLYRSIAGSAGVSRPQYSPDRRQQPATWQESWVVYRGWRTSGDGGAARRSRGADRDARVQRDRAVIVLREKRSVLVAQHQVGIEEVRLDIDVVRSGIVDAQTLFRGTPYAVLGVFVLAAVLTPPDWVSQVFLAVPMIALYLLGVGVAWLFGGGRKRAPSTADSTPS